MQRRIITLSLVALPLALIGCGGSDSGSNGSSTSKDDLVQLMVDQGAPQEQAECVADKLDGVTVDDLGEFFEAIGNDEQVEATEGVAKQFLDAGFQSDVSGG